MLETVRQIDRAKTLERQVLKNFISFLKTKLPICRVPRGFEIPIGRDLTTKRDVKRQFIRTFSIRHKKRVKFQETRWNVRTLEFLYLRMNDENKIISIKRILQWRILIGGLDKLGLEIRWRRREIDEQMNRENVSCKIVKVTSLPAKRTTTFFALWPGEIRRTSAASIRSRCA